MKTGIRLLTIALLLPASAARADTTGPDLAPDARALVDKWLKAQNAGDFAAYQQLYATRFNGVRRSGPRTVRLDRAGWIKDRERMFKKKMEVQADDVRVAATPISARVTLVQRFKQGTYSDVGPKQLVIVKEGDAAKIAREEMLRSEVTAKSAAGAGARERFSFFVDGGLVVADSVDAGWGRGARSVSLEDPVVVRQAVDTKQLPAEIAAWQGRAVTLYDNAGGACQTSISGFHLVGRVIPHFGTRDEWKTKKRKAIADEAWDMAGGSGQALVADVASACNGARWGRASSLPAPGIIAPAQDADAALTEKARKAFRALPAWAELQKSYKESEDKSTGKWDEDGTTIRRFTFPSKKGPRTLVTVTADVWQSCAGFGGSLWGVWEVEGGKLTLKSASDKGSAALPTLAVDLDGDGEPELYFDKSLTGDFGVERGVVLPAGGQWNVFENLSVPFLDCPC